MAEGVPLGLDIDFNDAVRFFQAVCGGSKCPACDSTGWNIPLENESSPVSVVNTGMTHEGLPWMAVIVNCRTCGFLRQHSAVAIQDWIKNNPDKGAADE